MELLFVVYSSKPPPYSPYHLINSPCWSYIKYHSLMLPHVFIMLIHLCQNLFSLFTKLAFIMPSSFKGTICSYCYYAYKIWEWYWTSLLQTTLCEKPIIEDILFLKIISTKCQPYYRANGIEKRLLPSSSTTCTTICELTDNFSWNHQQRQALHHPLLPFHIWRACCIEYLVVPQAGFLKDFVM
jgi:hypothetical protein